jgi:signal peptidase II
MLVVALSVGAIDQASKHWAHTSLAQQPRGRIDLVEDCFSLTYVRNPGAAWGFLSRRPASFRRPFFLAVSAVAIAFIIYLFVRLQPDQRMLKIALSLVMGGALGNLIDRVRFNYVIDFFDFYLGRTFRWPTFNVADVAISCGVGLLFLDMILVSLRQRRERRALATAGAAPGRPGGAWGHVEDDAGPPRVEVAPSAPAPSPRGESAPPANGRDHRSDPDDGAPS